jgi:hypothetical protein
MRHCATDLPVVTIHHVVKTTPKAAVAIVGHTPIPVSKLTLATTRVNGTMAAIPIAMRIQSRPSDAVALPCSSKRSSTSLNAFSAIFFSVVNLHTNQATDIRPDRLKHAALTVMYSLIGSATLNGLDPQVYLQ